MKLKVVITGGAGFIGSHIAEHWINSGAEVFVIDNLRTGHLKNISNLTSVNFVNGSVTDKELLNKVLKDADYVHNLAALVSVPESITNPFECVAINVNGLLNVLEASRLNKVKRVIHSSSAAIYGDNPVSPKTTDLNPSPKSPYGITKLDGEYYLQMYAEQYGMQTISFRYFNVFGPRQDPKSQYAAAIPIFVSQALKNEDIVIYGDGEQTRDFIFVKDVVKVNILATEYQNVSGVYNVGTGIATSINTLVKLVIEMTKSKSKIIYKDERPGDIKHSLSSIETTKKDLRFSPQSDLVSGLEETIRYFINLFE